MRKIQRAHYGRLREARVNLAEKTATVDYDPERASVTAMEASEESVDRHADEQMAE